MLIHADARQIPLHDKSVQCVVTSPPYWGLRDYGMGKEQLGLEPTPDLYVQHLVEIFREVRRVLKDDGTVWLNLGDSYAAGGRGEGGSPKQATNRGSLLGPHTAPPGFKPKDLVGIPWRVAFALQADGWYLRSDIIWSKPNPMPESVRDRPTQSHEYVFLLSKSKRYHYESKEIAEPLQTPPHTPGNKKMDSGGYSSGANISVKDRVWGANGTRNRRSVWTIPTQPYRGAHFATFPEKLVEPCILAGCPKGGIVLDPFCGSGTTVKVARQHGRIGLGLDLKPEYLRLARERV